MNLLTGASLLALAKSIYYIDSDRAKSAALVDILGVVLLQIIKSCDCNLPRQRELQKNKIKHQQ